MKTVKTEIQTISEAHRIVLRNIDRIPGRKRWTGANVFVVCPNPRHSDHTPSCSIYVGTDGKVPLGWVYCFGCELRGPWNKVADILKLERIQQSDTLQTSMGSINESQLEASLLGSISMESILLGFGLRASLDWNAAIDWRGIRGKLLSRMGALYSFDERRKSMVLIVPVTVDGELVGAVKCAEDSSAELKYVTSEGAWVKENGLLGYDMALRIIEKTNIRSVVLVEGVRDALRLLQKGIPAIALLGVKNWTERKMMQLFNLPVRHFVLCFDSDDAGIECTNIVRKSLKPMCGVSVVRTAEWAAESGMEKLDPGNMKKQHISKLKRLLHYAED